MLSFHTCTYSCLRGSWQSQALEVASCCPLLCNLHVHPLRLALWLMLKAAAVERLLSRDTHLNGGMQAFYAEFGELMMRQPIIGLDFQSYLPIAIVPYMLLLVFNVFNRCLASGRLFCLLLSVLFLLLLLAMLLLQQIFESSLCCTNQCNTHVVDVVAVTPVSLMVLLELSVFANVQFSTGHLHTETP